MWLKKDGYYFFKAPKGTEPIYTDKERLSQKYETLYKAIKKAIISILAIVVICIIGAHFAEKIIYTSGWFETFKLGLYMIVGGGIGLTLPLLICAVKAYKHIIKN